MHILNGVEFTRARDIKDPVLKLDVKRFDVLLPGWSTGIWWWNRDTGFIFELRRAKGKDVVTFTDRELWGPV